MKTKTYLGIKVPYFYREGIEITADPRPNFKTISEFNVEISHKDRVRIPVKYSILDLEKILRDNKISLKECGVFIENDRNYIDESDELFLIIGKKKISKNPTWEAWKKMVEDYERCSPYFEEVLIARNLKAKENQLKEAEKQYNKLKKELGK